MKRITASYRLALAACALAFAVSPAAAPPAYAEADSHPVVVSMGDSYASGEGTEPFYDQDKGLDGKFNSEDFLAHRSELAWSGLLKVDGVELRTIKGNGWYFTAVSGAEVENILTTSQLIEWDARPSAWDFRSGSYLITPQINVFSDRQLKGTVDYVTLSIGGNDLQFVPIVQAAATEVGYVSTNNLKAKLSESLDLFHGDPGEGKTNTKQDLVACYKRILEEAGGDAVLVVTGYPHLFTPGVGRLPFVDSAETRLINAAIDIFDDEMAAEAEKLDRVEFVDVRPAFNNNEHEYINGIILVRSDQDVKSLQFASAYSVHPNAKGHEAYRGAVQERIDRLEKAKRRSVAPEDFELEGSWKSTGSEGFGQAQPGVVVNFDGTHCNLYSPNDEYDWYTDDGVPTLDCKNWLWGDTVSFAVEIEDADHMVLRTESSSTVTHLERVGAGEGSGGEGGSGGAAGDFAAGQLDGLYANYDLPLTLYFDFYADGTVYAGWADEDGNVLGESTGYYDLQGSQLTMSVDLDATLAAQGADLGAVGSALGAVGVNDALSSLGIDLDLSSISLGVLGGLSSTVELSGSGDVLYIDGMAFYLV